MITPWSTNAVEITQNMAIESIIRIEEFQPVTADFTDFDPMISQKYNALTQEMYSINITPEPIMDVDDIAAYNKQEAYKDNVAFIKGPVVTQFAPKSADKPDYYTEKEFESVISLKAETHNFPTP
ncbi:hypothetical protein FQR65_LT15914 [Abscondita terminalis]|nr:hypothetical protein FQR65_LT15914 [Abscondita terminalis]